ncbi:unnamed protein product [Ilex paraguariensis]|uniref:C2 domain-containing protein n=1 Tax=Ilex paraguariensis TaxID=185542 RepID=A0ABC8SHN8_9AQUA
MFSPGRNYTLLTVELKSATLNFKRAGNFYMRVWINQKQKLETKVVSWIVGSDQPVWNQKFIFSVPNTFMSDENSTVRFKIFRERKYVPDSLVGRAECKVKSLFPPANMESRNGIEEEVKYDTENEFEDIDLDDDNEIQEVKEERIPELKASGSFEFSKGSSTKGLLDVEIVVWRSSDVSSVGDSNWKRFAMLYDEFMMGVGRDTEIMKVSFFMCLVLPKTRP